MTRLTDVEPCREEELRTAKLASAPSMVPWIGVCGDTALELAESGRLFRG
jgi:hypothetical protein